MKKLTGLLLALLVLSFGVSAQDEITLRLWAHQEGAFNAATQALIDAYMAENPNVTIEMETFEYDLYIQTLQTAMPAGDEADILGLFGSWVCSYSERLAPMPDGLVDTSVFFEAPMDGYTCGDAVYGLPQEFNLEYGAVLTNQAMFEAAGLAYPPTWETWDAFLSDAQALTQTGEDGAMTVTGYHFTNADAITFAFLAGILQNGGSYWNEDMSAFTFNTPEAQASLQHMVNMVEAGIVDPVLFNDSANWGGSAFFTDQASMVLIGPWAVQYGLADFPDFGEFDYVALPSFGEEPVFAADSGWGLSVSQNSSNADVAWDFVQFATTNAENALQWNIGSGTIPALRELVENEDYTSQLLSELPWLEAVLPELEYGQYIGEMPDRDLVFYDIIYPTILDTLQGMLSVEDALIYIEEDANASFE
ncbi:extracellular solute-binding protein [Phototrophicus methaneseepsis]|uniref:Extracellular solute-binding protein n=1 Tax=Phototrophicus methaneseepsis TaxID=2710758 RepID=A0A7S8EAG6_9CHLR|nr:extracellular solute-binding protein [Phototrophicus methaneseepsis]QPC83380.1 extracellular solute-binding protein [Phototrophicus methaneseepsis]